jgi:hypothetical protein
VRCNRHLCTFPCTRQTVSGGHFAPGQHEPGACFRARVCGCPPPSVSALPCLRCAAPPRVRVRAARGCVALRGCTGGVRRVRASGRERALLRVGARGRERAQALRGERESTCVSLCYCVSRSWSTCVFACWRCWALPCGGGVCAAPGPCAVPLRSLPPPCLLARIVGSLRARTPRLGTNLPTRAHTGAHARAEIRSSWSN